MRVYRDRFPFFSGSGPRGLKRTINWGSKVMAAIRAIIMARPVSSPKYMLGIKLERVRIENPMMMVTEV